MCGILGGWLPFAISGPKIHFDRGLAKLAHRGPNDAGLERVSLVDGVLVLGHTRLSIIDLSSAGHQPMHSRCGRYTLVFNGEIYNYRELREDLRALGQVILSDSDTEVLLVCWALWGQDCLSRLRGMFAFTVFDRLKRTLTCVRDAFGIKPFFYCTSPQGFLFASEVPALLAVLPNRPNLSASRAYGYLAQGRYDDSEQTFFEGIHQLNPGHALVIELTTQATHNLRRWWWPSVAACSDLTFDDAAEQLRRLFLENVRLHLRSDVSLGAALSGGVDSSAVVCAMRYVEPDMPIHTFTYVARGSTVDEESWADCVNLHVGAQPHKVSARPEELARDMDDMIVAQGEPFGSTSIYAQYRVFKLAREHGIVVTLDGQGADELLGGYDGYPGPRMRSLIDDGRWGELIPFLKAWSEWPDRTMTAGLKSLLNECLPDQWRHIVAQRRGATRPAWLRESYFRDVANDFDFCSEGSHASDSKSRRLMATLRARQIGGGLQALLRHGDRNSMRWSIESRVPFLTVDMAEFLLSLPEDYLVSAKGETKSVFRHAMRGIVPDTILNRRDKIGFATPEHAWLMHLGPQILSWLDAAHNLPFLDASACRAEAKVMLEGRKSFDSRMWRLVNYCRWSQLTT